MDRKYMYVLTVLAVVAGFGLNQAQSATMTSGHAMNSMLVAEEGSDSAPKMEAQNTLTSLYQ